MKISNIRKRLVNYIFEFNKEVPMDVRINILKEIVKNSWPNDLDKVSISLEFNTDSNKASIITSYHGKVARINRKFTNTIIKGNGKLITVNRKKYIRTLISNNDDIEISANGKTDN